MCSRRTNISILSIAPKCEEQQLLRFPLSIIVVDLFIPQPQCSVEQEDESEGQISTSMCLALGVQVELLWLNAIRPGPCDPQEFPQGGVAVK